MDAADLFKTAPKEVTRFFDGKDNLPTFDWRDIAPEEHAFAFTVAKSTGYDILDDVRTALKDAITNRVPFEEFQRGLMPLLQSKGWWGKALAVDPETSVEKRVQLGSPRRLRTIYWANTMTAHAAGEWERTERNKAFLPFLIYTLSTAERKRLEHERLVGTIAEVDDPIWDRIFPPNGWGCMCGTRQISRREAISRGWSPDDPPLVLKERPWTNKRTGEIRMLPEGVDPGWDTNPGKHRSANVSHFLSSKIEAMPAERQRIAIDDIVQSPVLKALAEGRMPGSWLPVSQMPYAAVNQLSATSAVVRLSSDSVHHMLNEHDARQLSVDDFRSALEIFANPSTALIPRGMNSLVMVGQDNKGIWWRMAAKLVASGSEWWWTSFHRKSEAEALKTIKRAMRRGEIIERE